MGTETENNSIKAELEAWRKPDELPELKVRMYGALRAAEAVIQNPD